MATARPSTDEGRVLRLTRTLRAPPAQVFRAWTEPAELIRWWGPKGFTIPVYEMDVREGGSWRTVMRSPEGRDHVVSGIYREITPPSRLVFTWGWEEDGVRGHETVVTVELFAVPEGTRLELTQELFESADSRDAHREGWASCLDCLEAALAEGAGA